MTIPWQVGGGKGYLERFRGDSVAGGQQEVLPDTLLQRNRARWEAGRCHLTRFCRETVPGGRRGDATWNTFAGIPCQVGSREMLPDTLSREYRGRWEAGKATWNDFAGIPWQVGGGKGYLERFCGKTVAGGRRERLPGTLLRGFRGRWAGRKDTG